MVNNCVLAGKPDACEVAFNFVKCGANLNPKFVSKESYF